MDDQNDQFSQEPQVLPQTPSPEENSKSTKKLLITAVLIMLLLGGALAAFWWFMLRQKPAEPVDNSNQPVPATLSKNPVVCVGMGVAYLQCKNVETNEIVKYELPKTIASAEQVVPSPTGTKFAVIYREGNIQKLGVFDAQLKVVGKVKSAPKGETLENPRWVDSDSLLEIKTIKSDTPQAQLNAVNVTTGETTELMKVDAGIETFMPVGDGRYIYGIRAKKDDEAQLVKRRLVLVDLQQKAEKDVKNDTVDLNTNEIYYEQGTQSFFASSLKDVNDSSTNSIRIYKVANMDTEPLLSQETEIKNATVAQDDAYSATTTTKGLMVHKVNAEGVADRLLYLVKANEQPTQLDLAVGGFVGMNFSLPSLPDFEKAQTQEVVATDFLDLPANTPKKIKAFLTKEVAENKNCVDGEYKALELEKFDGDTQFSAYAAGCEAIGLEYYMYKDTTYKKVAEVTEGMTCTQKDKLGISDVVLSPEDCRDENEPL